MLFKNASKHALDFYHRIIVSSKNPFFGYRQDVICLIFLQLRAITDRKLVISVYAMKQLI